MKQRMTLLKRKIFQSPTRLIVLSFVFLIVFGTILLLLPASQNPGRSTSLFGAFFTAASASCITGLTAYDTFDHWSMFGQIVILALIQIGGLGIVTFTTFFNVIIGRKLGLKNALAAKESINNDSIAGIRSLFKMVIGLTFLFELIGALVLMITFVPKYGAQGVFISIFLSISSFCNAGFDILSFEGQSSAFSNYLSQPLVIIPVMLLIVIGGLGFVVWNDIIGYRKNKRLNLHSVIVLKMTLFLILFGWVLFLLLEWANPETLGAFGYIERFVVSLFHSVSVRTAGFNAINVGGLGGPSKLLTIVLMFIGAAPGSAGGGVKITTVAVLAMTVFSVMRGREDTIILGRKVPKHVVYKAFAVTTIALVAVALVTCIVYYTNQGSVDTTGLDVAVESVSAFSTAGLSTGISASTSNLSRVFLFILMFMGRVGPISLGLALSVKQDAARNQIYPEGKIMIG